MSTKLRDFWRDHDVKILTFFTIILTAFVAFRAGQTHEQEKNVAKINVSINDLAATNPMEQKIKTLEETLERKGISMNQFRTDTQENTMAELQKKECTIVASKNSDKYHLSSCAWAKRIKEENRICFSSKQKAEEQGRKPAKCCH